MHRASYSIREVPLSASKGNAAAFQQHTTVLVLPKQHLSLLQRAGGSALPPDSRAVGWSEGPCRE